jgi:hypothetical protein
VGPHDVVAKYGVGVRLLGISAEGQSRQQAREENHSPNHDENRTSHLRLPYADFPPALPFQPDLSENGVFTNFDALDFLERELGENPGGLNRSVQHHLI